VIQSIAEHVVSRAGSSTNVDRVSINDE